MRITPTLEGGLRIDAEDLTDWEVLHAIVHDAQRPEIDLANNLGNLIKDESTAGDWEEYVIPDLREGFENQLSIVAKSVQEAVDQSAGEPGSVWIAPADGFPWYGALNQARLALEDLHHFGPGDSVAIGELCPASRSAFLRSHFYLTLQSLLLDYVLK